MFPDNRKKAVTNFFCYSFSRIWSYITRKNYIIFSNQNIKIFYKIKGI